MITPKPLLPRESRVNFNGSVYPTTVVKYYSAEGRSATDGTWRLDLSEVGLKKVFAITATPNIAVTGLSTAPIVTVAAFSPTEVRGYVLLNNTGGILIGGTYSGLKLSNVATSITVFVVGV